MQICIQLRTEAETALAAQMLKPYFSQNPEQNIVIYLHGMLGAGKSTFARHLIWAMGYSGSVKSPSYTLIESYGPLECRMVYHLDCYRLRAPTEVVELGLDSCEKNALFLIEWPENGAGYLPGVTIDCYFSMMPEQGETARVLEIFLNKSNKSNKSNESSSSRN